MYKGSSDCSLSNSLAHQLVKTYIRYEIKMKLPTFVTLFSLSTAVTAVLEARQQCSEDSCYRAVYGEGAFSRVVQGVQDCEDYLTTSVIWHPM